VWVLADVIAALRKCLAMPPRRTGRFLRGNVRSGKVVFIIRMISGSPPGLHFKET
jgi:hypothetical protein